MFHHSFLLFICIPTLGTSYFITMPICRSGYRKQCYCGLFLFTYILPISLSLHHFKYWSWFIRDHFGLHMYKGSWYVYHYFGSLYRLVCIWCCVGTNCVATGALSLITTTFKNWNRFCSASLWWQYYYLPPYCQEEEQRSLTDIQRKTSVSLSCAL